MTFRDPGDLATLLVGIASGSQSPDSLLGPKPRMAGAASGRAVERAVGPISQARAARMTRPLMLPIADVAARLGLTPDLLEPYGSAIAKIRLDALERFPEAPRQADPRHRDHADDQR